MSARSGGIAAILHRRKAKGFDGMTRKINPVHRATRRCLLAAALASVLWGSGAWAQTPTIRIVSPFPTGGGSGTMLRLLADHIGRTHGVTVIVEHRTGAGALIA